MPGRGKTENGHANGPLSSKGLQFSFLLRCRRLHLVPELLEPGGLELLSHLTASGRRPCKSVEEIEQFKRTADDVIRARIDKLAGLPEPP